MLPSAEFICLRVAYREAFWEELISRLTWRERSIRRLFWVHVIFFHSLPSRVGCSFHGKLFSIFKLLCLVFGRYYLSSRTAHENCVLFVIALRSSWENFFADTRFVLFTQVINLSRLCLLLRRFDSVAKKVKQASQKHEKLGTVTRGITGRRKKRGETRSFSWQFCRFLATVLFLSF